MLQDLLSNWIYILPAVFIAFSFHEFAHSFVAYKLGDTAQKESGRLSLNPINHIDPIGFISLVSVSYTHLDVYKRQIPLSGAWSSQSVRMAFLFVLVST